MQELNLPAYTFKYKTVKNRTQIFDRVRKKYLILTPEEWVRQNFISYLIEDKKYPSSLISIESGLRYHQLSKRTDILVYSSQGKPFLLVECKAPEIKLKNETFEQISRYNAVVKAEFLIVTNGIDHYCFNMDYQLNKSTPVNEIPNHK
jgi:hypothetical protein